MLDKRMEEALNKQFNAEMYSAYLYLSMSAHFEDKNLPGFAHWMKQQVQEETFHGMKFYGFIIDRGGRVDLKAIEAPPAEWSSAVDVFTETLKHERYVTSLINELASLATELNQFWRIEGTRPKNRNIPAKFLSLFINKSTIIVHGSDKQHIRI